MFSFSKEILQGSSCSLEDIPDFLELRGIWRSSMLTSDHQENDLIENSLLLVLSAGIEKVVSHTQVCVVVIMLLDSGRENYWRPLREGSRRLW